MADPDFLWNLASNPYKLDIKSRDSSGNTSAISCYISAYENGPRLQGNTIACIPFGAKWTHGLKAKP
jgi:hypothetical protein